MSYETVKVTKKDRIATITLNRAQALNSINYQLMRDVRQALKEIEPDTEAKVVVVTGEGKAFCAGADLTVVGGSFDTREGWKQFSQVYLEEFNQTMLALEECPLPVIAMVNGFTFAGGLEIMLSCDFAIAAEDAQIGDQHINFGLMGGPVNPLLARRIGEQRALELLMSGRWLSGKEAEQIGLVYKAVPREKLEEETNKFASLFTEKSRDAFGFIKRAVKQSYHLSLAEAFECGVNQARQYMTTSDNPKIGVKSFLEKKGFPKF